MTNTETVTLKFTDGQHRTMSAEQAEGIVGLDRDGDVVVEFMDGFAPLTSCCKATGKGSGVGTVCRGCYREVAWKFGTMVERTARRVGMND